MIAADPRKTASSRITAQTTSMTLVQALNQALADELSRDERVILLGEDIGPDGGVFRVTEGLIKKFGPERVMDTPLAEAGIVGVGVGLCVTGFRPVLEIQFMGFMYQCMNHLLAHAARMRHRSRGRFPMPMVVRTPYGGGIRPPEHHSESYEALLANTPGIKVVVPSNPYDAKGLLIAAIRDEDPVVFLEPTRLYRAMRQDVPAGAYEVPLGQANVVKPGEHVTIIAWGSMVPFAVDAAKQLEADGISAEVVDVRSLVPLDVTTIITSVAKTGRAVVVHEAPRTCGFGAEIVAQINEKALLSLHSPVQRVTGYDTIFPGAQLEHFYLPTPDRIITAVRKVLED